MITNIETINDVRTFFRQLIFDELVAFHPDTDFTDYVNESGEPSYTKEEADFRNQLRHQCFEVCDRRGTDIYGIGIRLQNEFFNTK